MKKALASIIVITAISVLAPMVTQVLAFDEILPTEAYNMVTTRPKTYIIDVRSAAEYKWVGHPGENWLGEGAELNGKVINIPWTTGPNEDRNFIQEVIDTFDNDARLIMMCRSGTRGVWAANYLEAYGYIPNKIFNMLNGFEGYQDIRGYRTLNGWKIDGLPYVAHPPK